MGGLNLYRLDLKPKKGASWIPRTMGYVTKNRLEFFIETESHMFKRKIVLKDVSKDALLFFHIFFFGGGFRSLCDLGWFHVVLLVFLACQAAAQSGASCPKTW